MPRCTCVANCCIIIIYIKSSVYACMRICVCVCVCSEIIIYIKSSSRLTYENVCQDVIVRPTAVGARVLLFALFANYTSGLCLGMWASVSVGVGVGVGVGLKITPDLCGLSVRHFWHMSVLHDSFIWGGYDIGRLRLVGSFTLLVSFAEYRLSHRALLQKRRIISKPCNEDLT